MQTLEGGPDSPGKINSKIQNRFLNPVLRMPCDLVIKNADRYCIEYNRSQSQDLRTTIPLMSLLEEISQKGVGMINSVAECIAGLAKTIQMCSPYQHLPK